MRKLKKIASLALAGAVTASLVMSPAAVADGSKYVMETTKDGWVKVINDNGVVLGYTEGTGVTIIEDDGYAFKDLNKNGKLDAYEDWRLDADTRAENLIEQMDVQEMLPLMLLKEYDMQYNKARLILLLPSWIPVCVPYVRPLSWVLQRSLQNMSTGFKRM